MHEQKTGHNQIKFAIRHEAFGIGLLKPKICQTGGLNSIGSGLNSIRALVDPADLPNRAYPFSKDEREIPIA